MRESTYIVRWLCLLGLIAASGTVVAQRLGLVADLNSQASNSRVESMVVVPGYVVYLARSVPAQKLELWSTNTTTMSSARIAKFDDAEKLVRAGGLALLSGIRTGDKHKSVYAISRRTSNDGMRVQKIEGRRTLANRSISIAKGLGKKAVFNLGLELWVTNGSQKGTRPLRITSGNRKPGAELCPMQRLGSYLVFYSYRTGYLFRSDGNVIENIGRVKVNSTPSSCSQLRLSSRILIGHNRSIYSVTSTGKVSLVYQGKFRFERFLGIHGSRIFFTSRSQGYSQIVGLDTKSKRLRVLRNNLRNVSDAYSVNGQFVFRARSNGAEINLYGIDSQDNRVRKLTTLFKNTQFDCRKEMLGKHGGGVLFFKRVDAQCQLWVTDGTLTGTRSLSNYKFDSNSTFYSGKNREGIYFVNNNYEIWKGDGVTSAAKKALIVYENTGGSLPSSLIEIPQGLAFVTQRVDRDQQKLVTSDRPWIREAWILDKTSNSLDHLGHPCSANATRRYGETDFSLTTFLHNDVLHVLNDGCRNVGGSEDPSKRAIWQYTASSEIRPFPKQFTQLTSGYDLVIKNAGLASVGSRLYYNSVTGGGNSLQFYGDSEPRVLGISGQSVVKDISKDVLAMQPPSPPVLTGSFPQDFTAIGTTVFFSANQFVRRRLPNGDSEVSGTGRELWKTDGTEAGTVMVKDIANEPIMTLTTDDTIGHSSPQNLTAVGTTLFFSARDSVYGRQLWRSDGSEANTRRVAVLNSTESTSFGTMIAFGNQLVFAADDGVRGMELWISDGTATGTKLVSDIARGAESAEPRDLTVLNDKVYFTASDTTAGRELWLTDGTKSGTMRVADINPGAPDANPRSLAVFDSKLYFSAFETTNGRELWVSDGTATGTKFVEDLNPGINNSNPRHITEANGTLYLVANDGTTGAELWQLNN